MTVWYAQPKGIIEMRRIGWLFVLAYSFDEEPEVLLTWAEKWRRSWTWQTDERPN
jgi:hypothetical protein